MAAMFQDKYVFSQLTAFLNRTQFNNYVRKYASENKPGTGIGLSIVKGIVEAHNGKINVDSKINEGSSFSITLPLVQKDAITDKDYENNDIPEDIIPEQFEITDTSEHPVMLIVDDNEDMINFLSENFKSNYTILTASDGIEALERLNEQEVSLIITDWMMPNMNGIEATKQIRSSNKDVKIII